ncbi:M20/M25/M40 family metallo-hydrolase [Streptomyces avidinii]|uniref:Acetylornithine deacetylase/succinyl-diaminopimelate desuccinylase-like protein n=1 Tax=Streptomyces avidinii TaxID=1895 RepID=A0ABS4KZL4_STRAV|nr:M20/M25/M40 family metallo-hydrolase [Streptomyces avidinii]MBP2035473.1 acetylornithine deacetylase/succinyl-diaminopimelate desuccinylase-like protein [Streptomyces avidinii]GGZ02221.1 peptidase [Streptomyces avidinii]
MTITAPGAVPGDDALAELAEWVRIASVSSDPDRAQDVRRSARWLVEALRRTGFPRAEVWETEGLPAVCASWPAADPGAPVLLVYSHHDVHAVDPSEWQVTEPFSPLLRDGRLHGRGASDAKGQVMSHLWALRTHLAQRTAPAVTVKYLIEGEEEVGSVHLAELLSERADDLNADVVMVSDSMLWSLDDPTVCAAVRGSVTATLTIRGAERDLHSGAVSGAAGNAAVEMCRLVDLLGDATGRVALPDFYDAVATPGPNLRAGVGSVPFDLPSWQAETGTFGAPGEAGFTVPERLWTRPSAEVARLAAGRTDAPALGLIPAEASADLLFRLVPDQRADQVADQLRAWLARHRRPGFTYELEISSTISDPYRTPPDAPALAALTRAVSDAYGAPARHIGNGGAAPGAQLASAFNAPVLFFGTGLPADRWHGPDERVEIQALRLGVSTLAQFLDELSTGDTPTRQKA